MIGAAVCVKKNAARPDGKDGVLITIEGSHVALHFVERLDELIEILGVEHDGRFLTAARLLGNFEELAVAGFFQVDIERALFGVDRHGVKIVREAAIAPIATAMMWARRVGWSRTIIHWRTAGKFGHWIEHIGKRKEIRFRRSLRRESSSACSQSRNTCSIRKCTIKNRPSVEGPGFALFKENTLT